MAGFSSSPIDNLLAESQAGLAGAMAPQPRAAEQADSAMPNPTLVRSFEAAADQYGIPVDALMAIAQKDSNFDPLARSRGVGARTRGIIKTSDDDLRRTGINPYRADQAINAAAQKIKGYLDSGMSIEDAIKAHVAGTNRDAWGPEAQEYLDDVMGRARKIADAIYPVQQEQPAPAKQKSEGTWYGDIGRALDRGAGTVMNAPFEIASAMGSDWAESKAKPVRDYIEASRKQDSEGLQASRAAFDQVGGRIGKAMKETGAGGMGGWLSTIAADPMAAIRDFGDSASAVGSDPRLLSTMAAESLPSMAAIGAGGGVAGGIGIFASSTGMSAATIAEKVNSDVAGMSGAEVRRLAPQAKTVEEARSTVKQNAFFTLETLGLAIASGAMDVVGHGAERMIAGGLRETGGIVRNTVKGAGTEAAQETAQSAFENVGTARAQDSYQPEKDNWSGIIRDTAAGTVTGGAMGGGAGAISGARGRRDPVAASSAQTLPPAAPAPASQAEGGAGSSVEASASDAPAPVSNPPAQAPMVQADGGAGATAPGPVPPAPSAPVEQPAAPAPSGPLGRALDAGAPHMREAAKPAGGIVVVTDEAGERVGHVVGHDRDGILVKYEDGAEELLDPQDIASGAVKMTAATEASPAAEQQADPVAPAAPQEMGGDGRFAPETGTLGVPRSEMPQVESQHHGALVNHLNAKGIAHETTEVDAAALKPTQAEYSPEKVERAKEEGNGDRSIIVSNDGHIIDGHHQAVAAAEKGEPVKAIVLDAPVKDALEAVKGFPSAKTDSGETASGPKERRAQEKERRLADMNEPELRERLKYLAGQAKANGGWNRMLFDERKAVEKEIGLRQRAARAAAPAENQAQSAPAAPVKSDPLAGKWFSTKEKAEALIAKSGATETHEAVQTGKYRWDVKPRQEAAAPAPVAPQAVAPAPAVKPASAPAVKPTAKQKADAGRARVDDFYTPGSIVSSYGGGADRVVSFERGKDGRISVTVEAMRRDGDKWVGTGETRTHSTEPDKHARVLERAAPAAEPTAPAVKRKAEATHAPAEWAPSREAAQKRMAKLGLSDTHEAIQTGAHRWDIRQRQAAAEEKPKFSIEDSKGYLGPVQSAAIDSILSNGKRGNPVIFATTPPVLQALGVKNTPVVAPQSVIWKAGFDKHGLTGKQIKAALDGLANPIMVFDSQTINGSFVVLVDVPGEPRPIVIAVHPNESVGRLEVSRIASIHAKDRSGSVFKWIDDGLTRYINKLKAGEWVRSRGLQLPKDGSPKHRLGLKILQHRDVFKPSEGAAPESGSFRSSDTLSRHLTAGTDGALVGKLIDAERIQIHDDASTLPSGLTASGPVQGVTMPDGTIHLVAGNLTPETVRGVLLHEMFHAGVRPLVKEQGWNELLKRVGRAAANAEARGDTGSFWRAALARARAADTSAAHMAEEVAAYAIENVERAPAGIREMVDGLIGRVKAWALRTFGRQIGEVTPEQLRALAVSALRSWQQAPDISTDKGARYSVAATAPEEMGGKGSLVAKAKQQASDILTNAMAGKLTPLAFVPTRPLFMELAADLPSARKYLRSKEAMDAMRSEMTGEAATLTEKWGSFALRRRADNRRIADLMHETTIAQVDPAKPLDPKATAAQRAQHAEFKKRFEAMPRLAREIYVEARDLFTKRADQSEREVIDNMRRAIDSAMKKAEREHADELRRLDEKGVTGPERADAIAEADRKLTLARTRTRRMRNARLKRLREAFESNRLAGPYFPLSRFGRFFVTVRDGDGKVLSFSRFEGAQEQRAFAQEMEKDRSNRVETGLIEEKTKAEAFLDPRFVADVDTILEMGGAPVDIRDAVWQRYLDTLPDLSMRKHQIHRKNRAGFSNDALRAFASSMFHSAHQIARLRYGLELQEHMDGAGREVRGAKDPTRSGAVFDEMKKAHDFTMNPTVNAWSYRATSFVFLYTMWANISSALVNLDQAWTKGLPVLGYDAETGNAGVRQAAAATAGALIDYVKGRGFVANSPSLTVDEKAAVGEAYRRSVIDATQAHDLAGVAERGADYSPLASKVMNFGSWPLHQTERLNREITFLAGYRLSRTAGLDHDAAITKAADQTYATHYDSQASGKARFMRGSVGRAIFALKSFQANVLWRLFRDIHQTTEKLPPAERKAAIGRATAMVALSVPAAGLKGAAFISILLPIAGFFMGMAGSDDDPEEALRKAVLDAAGDTTLGRAVGGMLMDGLPGYLTGTELSGRIGMGDLWFRSNNREMDAERTWNYWLEQLLGAPVGIAHQVWQGGAEAAKGNIVRGVTKALPSALKNPATAARWAAVGVTDRSGDAIVEKVAPQDVFKKLLGFMPAEIADRYARNTFQANAKARIQGEQAQLRGAVARAQRAGDADAIDKAMSNVDAWNERHPEQRVTSESIRKARQAMANRSNRKEFGVDLPKGLGRFIREKTAPSIYSRQE